MSMVYENNIEDIVQAKERKPGNDGEISRRK